MATDNEILCGEESDCQATEKVMAVVNANYYKLDEKIDKQAEDLKKHLERLSADLFRHDERLKLHVESQSKFQQNVIRDHILLDGDL